MAKPRVVSGDEIDPLEGFVLHILYQGIHADSITENRSDFNEKSAFPLDAGSFSRTVKMKSGAF